MWPVCRSIVTAFLDGHCLAAWLHRHCLPRRSKRHPSQTGDVASRQSRSATAAPQLPEERRAHALRLEPKLYPPNLVEEVLDNLFAEEPIRSAHLSQGTERRGHRQRKPCDFLAGRASCQQIREPPGCRHTVLCKGVRKADVERKGQAGMLSDLLRAQGAASWTILCIQNSCRQFCICR